MGDLVVSVPHSDADQDWIYGAVAATGYSSSYPGAIEPLMLDMVPFGWFPVAWWEAASNIEMGYDYADFLCASVSRSGFMFLCKHARPVLLTPTLEIASSKEVLRAILASLSWALEGPFEQIRDATIHAATDAFCNVVSDNLQNQDAAVEVGAIEVLRELPSYPSPTAATSLASRACSALASRGPVLQKLIIYAGLLRDIGRGTHK